MADVICPTCSEPFAQRGGPGRPLKYCSVSCGQDSRHRDRYTPRAKEPLLCTVCGESFPGWYRQRYCSKKCGDAAGYAVALSRRGVECVGCGKLTLPGKGSLERPTCRDCRRGRGVCLGCGGNAERSNTRCNRCSRERAHGLQLGAVERMLAIQGGRCAVCRAEEPGIRGWTIDHDHRCCFGDLSCGSCVRGVLCMTCNTGLGMFGDDPAQLQRAIDYLASPRLNLEVR